jgi:hypothetical protein
METGETVFVFKLFQSFLDDDTAGRADVGLFYF